MKFFRPLLVATALVVVPNTFAQQTTSSERPPLITDVYFPVGFVAGSSALMTTTDWRNLMPNSELLKNDLSWDTGDQTSFGRGRYVGEYRPGDPNSVPAFEVSIGLDMGRKQGADARFEKQLRVGASYLGTGSSYRNWWRSATGRYDTLTSSLNGQTSFVDTTWNETYSAEYRFSRIGLNASYILRKRTPNKWSWYVGIGGMVGTTFNASASVEHRIYTEANTSVPDYPELGGYFDNEEREEMHVATTAWGAAYALAGIDLRLGRTNPFWSSVHLFNELRPAMMFNTVPGSKLASTAAIQNLFGLRLDLR